MCNKKDKYYQLVVLFFLLVLFHIACARKPKNDLRQASLRQASIPNSPKGLQKGEEVATVAGGCFWCVEAVFERVKGVRSVISGYSGGKEKNPTYKEVSYGKTTHAEAVQIIFDPKMVSYQTLMEVFFATHDPTQLNRQGPDAGEQYRSAVFFHDNEQEEIVKSYIKKLEKSGKFSKPIVTQVEPYTVFYRAEAYHQDFYELNPRQGYVVNVTRPKVDKFEKQFKSLLKEKYLK